MKKFLLIQFLGSIVVTNFCFSANFNQELQEVYKRYAGCEQTDQHAQGSGETSYNVYQQAPKRNGFQNEELPSTSTSQRYGDTTYHTYYPAPTRKGFTR